MPKSLLENKREAELMHVLGLKQPDKNIRFINVTDAKQRISAVQDYNTKNELNGFHDDINYMINKV